MVCEGPSNDFYDILINLSRELRSLKLINSEPHAVAGSEGETKLMWDWLCSHARGSKLSFLSDGFYSAEWNQKNYEKVLNSVITRLTERGDVDLILAFGTWAGQEMSSIHTSVPVIVCGASDPLGAGIIRSVTDSGKDNLVAVVEPNRFLRQIEYFHRIFAFKKLGVTYTDTPSGRSCAAIDQIEKACARNGVELVRCTGEFLHSDAGILAAGQMEACHKMFVEKKVDTVYISYNSIPSRLFPQVLAPLIKADIPTISQSGAREVRMGALTSITSYCKKEGVFVAKLIRGLLQGAKPRSLPQQLRSPELLSINVETAANIGWSPSLEVLLSVDEFFQSITY
ncbi:MAG: ABC transporter substrate-binding protein [Desulfovibrio sp.]|nr:ABC transporter substrate-binding protein [Desulfovibrio sp.]